MIIWPYFIIITGMSSLMCQSNSQRDDNVTVLLDNLFHGYSHHIRPDTRGPPTEVFIDLEVRSLGPVSEVDMTYSMDCYFRQNWRDQRLAFHSHSMDSMALSISMLEKIWRPDTSFLNGKYSFLHTITQPNKFVRLNRDGSILYSSRLTISASCPMELHTFPMDTQICSLHIGSTGYPTTDVIFLWNLKRRVVIAKDVKLSQFDLIETHSFNSTLLKRRDKIFSVLKVQLHLKRHMGYFLIQVYAPCTLLVVLSWVSFWINREATADRIALGIMTILTMTFLALDSRNDLPKVSYCTALDYYVAISFFFVFATIVEFAIVHYYTKVGSGEYYFTGMLDNDARPISNTKRSDDDDMFTDSEDDSFADIPPPPSPPRWPKACNSSQQLILTVLQNRVSSELCQIERKSLSQQSELCIQDYSPEQQQQQYQQSSQQQSQQQYQQQHLMNSVSKIDRVSRAVFPITFFIVSCLYWRYYLYTQHQSS